MKPTALLVSVILAASPLTGPSALPWGAPDLPATAQIAPAEKTVRHHASSRTRAGRPSRGPVRPAGAARRDRAGVAGPVLPPPPKAPPVPPARRNGAGSSLSRQKQECRGDNVCLRVLREYGAVFAAANVRVPSRVIFPNEQAVRGFQSDLSIARMRIGGINIELQPAAMRALEAAIAEAKRVNLTIRPRGTDAARRSFAETVGLWRQRVDRALTHWVAAGRLTRRDGDRLRSLSPAEQVPEVLRWEAQGLNFSTKFDRSILQSVAAPGTSQHLSLLALDVTEHDNPRVREILARHGWYQTVSQDLPHFTYLGVAENSLSARGLRREVVGGRTVWTPDLKSASDPRVVPPAGRNPTVTGGVRKGGPVGGGRVRMASTVVLTERTVPLVDRLAQAYFDRTGSMFFITSGYRTPAQQASAMYGNLVRYGIPYVRHTYGGRPAAMEIIAGFIRNRRYGRKAIRAMTGIIESQVARGIYVSRHMRALAVDIRMNSARRRPLGRSVAEVGGDLVIEIDHYHVQFAG